MLLVWVNAGLEVFFRVRSFFGPLALEKDIGDRFLFISFAGAKGSRACKFLMIDLFVSRLDLPISLLRCVSVNGRVKCIFTGPFYLSLTVVKY